MTRTERALERSSAAYHSTIESRMEKAEYFGGLDLGQTTDFTTFVVLRRLRYLISEGVTRGDAGWRDEKAPVFQVGHITRFPLGTLYPQIVANIGRMMLHEKWSGNITLAIDQTGVGRPVCDLFRAAGISFAGITITGGDSESRDGAEWRIPKLTLVSRLQALFHQGLLHIHKDLPEAAELTKELESFRVGFTAAGHMQFGARTGAHDDLVLALALACWRATKVIQGARLVPISWIGR